MGLGRWEEELGIYRCMDRKQVTLPFKTAGYQQVAV